MNRRTLLVGLLIFCALSWQAFSATPGKAPEDLAKHATISEDQKLVDRSMGLDQTVSFNHQSELFKASDLSTTPFDLTLEKTIELAIKSHLLTRISEEKINEVNGQKWQAASTLLPHLTAAMYQQRTGKFNFAAMGFRQAGLIGPFNTFDARFFLTQKSLDLSALSRFQASRINSQMAENEEKLARQKVIMIASAAYIEALRAYGAYKAAEADYLLAERLLKQTKHQNEVGIATGVDLARANTRLAEEKFRLERTKTDVHEAYLDLQRVTGLSFSSTLRLVNSLCFIDAPLPSLHKAVQNALDERLEMQIAQDQIRASKFQLYGAVTEVLPKFDFNGDYGLSGIEPNKTARQTGEVTFRLSMPLFEGGLIAGQIKETKSQKKQAEIQFDDLKRQIEEDVHLSLWTLETNIEQVKAASQVVQFAHRELEMAGHRFAQGVGDNIEVVNAQTILARAQDDYVVALSLYHTARMNLYFALGRAEEFYLQKIES